MDWVADAIFSDGGSSPRCASAQWEVVIAGYNRVVASYPCAGSNGTENNKQSWVRLLHLLSTYSMLTHFFGRLWLKSRMLKKSLCLPGQTQ